MNKLKIISFTSLVASLLRILPIQTHRFGSFILIELEDLELVKTET